VIRDLRRARSSDPSHDWCDVLYVGSADVEATQRFFTDFAPESHCIADPSGELYESFGLGKGNAWQLFGPAVFAHALGAMWKGNGIGVPSGDVLRMSGFFRLEHGSMTWAWRGKHVGDHPSLDTVRAHACRTPNAKTNATS
jgi:hypothetical protein